MAVKPKRRETPKGLSILVPSEVYRELSELAKAEDRSLGAQTRRILEEYLDARRVGAAK